MAESSSRRERKRVETRRHIAVTAAALFAERGYEQVAVIDVARAADVAEQTVYNHFPTKEHLVLDEDDGLREELVSALTGRAAGTSPATAVRPVLLRFVAQTAELSPVDLAGGLGSLAAKSPAVRRLSLAMTDRHASAMAAAMIETAPGLDPDLARLHATALAWVVQAVTDLGGRLAGDGLDGPAVSDRQSGLVTRLLDDLDRWPAA